MNFIGIEKFEDELMISVIVPVYNMIVYLPRCMDSLLQQSASYEIILVDDGSTDGSGVLCDKYAQKYPELVHVVHKKNGGLSSARNAGMDSALGEYVIFPDPDDWMELNFLQHLSDLQGRYRADLICIGYSIDYDESCIPANENEKLTFMDGMMAQRPLLIPPRISGFAWNKLFRLDLIREHNLFFLDNVGTTEDLDFAYRYLEYCNTVCFDPNSRLYHYYQREGAATHMGFSRKQVESIHTYEKLIQSSSDDILVRAAKEEICNIAVNLIWSYKISECEDDEVWKQLKQYVTEYLKSAQYGKNRKIQAVFACFIPSLYVFLKNRVTKMRK